ncbi:hypothetical protein FRB96_008256 [Tulasnella sp. 330]|nr:hypothetical protein FRB96_008256 [Tulasnella sp. 330]
MRFAQTILALFALLYTSVAAPISEPVAVIEPRESDFRGGPAPYSDTLLDHVVQ